MKRFLPYGFMVFLIAAVALAQEAPSVSAPGQAPTSAVHGQQEQAPAKIPTPQTTLLTQPTETDPLLEVPPLPKSDVSLVGGIVTGIDRVRDKLTVRAFGGQKMKFQFDERTHIYRNGRATTMLGINKGDRVYVDTQLDGPKLFARNIRVQTEAGPAYAQGQILAYDQNKKIMTLRDDISSQPVAFLVNSKTTIEHEGRAASAGDLLPGALIAVHFAPDRANRGAAQEITVYATPGESFVFAGKITHLDLSTGVLALQNRTDNKSYEIHFDRDSAGTADLGLGSDITVNAVFDGRQYKAQNLAISQARTEP